MKRRILSALLALMMVLTLLPATALAEEAPTSGIGGESVTWVFDEATGMLTFSGSGEMDSYASGTPAPWLAWSKDIITVAIDSGVTSIGGCAFVDCTALTSVSIPETVTHIWDGAFARCSSLYDVTLPEGIVNVGNSAFENCSSLKMITIRGTNVNVGHAAFKNCSALEKVTIGAGVKEIGWYTFQSCTALTQITFEGDVPSYVSADAFTGVTAIAYYPEGNETWTEETMVDYGGSLTWTAACPEHSYADSVCTVCGMEDPEKIIEPDLPVTSGTCGENTFWSFDESTGTLTISGTGATYDFEGAAALPWLDYLQQITTVIVEPGITEIGDCLASGARNLTKVSLPEGLTRIGKASFDGNFALQEIEFPESLTYIGEMAFWYSDLIHITIPANVKTIGPKAFWFCNSLKEIMFEGDAPEFLEQGVFIGVTATAYYPAGNATWTEEIRAFCEGEITWVPYGTSDVIRIAGADRILTSMMLADQLKQTLGVEKFDTVIVASALNFPDALTGSYLAAVKDAPILLTYEAAHSRILAYIQANLVPGGTAYILGGESAVSADFENRLKELDITCKRLAGTDRFGTNLEILKEAGVTAEQEILICTAVGFADSLSASAAGLPILLVSGSLSDAQKAFLAATSGKFVIIGGTSAVSTELEAELNALGEAERVGGASRYETSVLVAQRFVSNPDGVVLAYARNYPDGLCGGPLAVSMNAALILTDNYAPSAADAYAEGLTSGIVVGGTGLISDETVRDVFDLYAGAEISAK